MKNPDITPELQIEINRAKWIQALRENGHRQCTGMFINDNGALCATWLVRECLNLVRPVTSVDALKYNIGQVVADNDRGWTFVQIADAAEKGRYW